MSRGSHAIRLGFTSRRSTSNMASKSSPVNLDSHLRPRPFWAFCETKAPTKGIMVLTNDSLALVTLVVPHYFNGLARSGYVSKGFRRFCSDYGMPLTIVAATGLAYWGRFNP